MKNKSFLSPDDYDSRANFTATGCIHADATFSNEYFLYIVERTDLAYCRPNFELYQIPKKTFYTKMQKIKLQKKTCKNVPRLLFCDNEESA